MLGAIGLAGVLVEAEEWLAPRVFDDWPRLFGAGAVGARGLLTTVATTMITVAGVVFSSTLIALSVASSQYSSRVLRNFMSDRGTQSVLGAFVGIFAYCLVVLRTIRGGDEGAFVPSLAVLGGLLLGFVGIAVFIYFIHHISLSIQASHILAAVSAETLQTVDNLYPEAAGGEVRLRTCGPTFADLVGESFDQIRQGAAGNVAVLQALLGSIERLAGRAIGSSRQHVLLEHALAVADLGQQSVPAPRDRQRVDVGAARVIALLRGEATVEPEAGEWVGHGGIE